MSIPPAPGDGQVSASGDPSALASDPAARLREQAARISGELARVVDEHPALDRVPGRSVTLVGAGLVAVAVALSALPSFSGIGLAWSVVMLAGGAVVAMRELAGAGRNVPEERLPALLRHPLLPAGYAALAVLHAFLLFRVGIVPLLWTGAAALLVWDQYRRAAASADGLVHRFDVRRAWHGYRRNVSVGVSLCLASLFLTWGQSSGYWTGGYSYNYGYRYDSYSGTSGYGYAYDYQPMQYYWPGWEVSGRNQSFALLAVALLLGLVLWASLRPGQGGALARSAGVWMGAGLAAFWLFAAKDGAGALLFLIGLGTALSGAWRIRAGEERGRWDLERLWGLAVARVRR